VDYLVWEHKDEGNSCLLTPPEEIPRDWELLKGVPRAAGFPADAVFRMSNDHKRNIGLPDNVMNLAGLAVVHLRLQRFLEAKALKNVEYLPVSIINHKQRIASRDYFIVHPVEPQDALDLARSGVTFNAIIPTDISSVDDLVLDPPRIDPDVRLFRLKNFGSPLLIERALSEEITRAGFTGTGFIELDRYGK
jgi:hypothetical protein